MDLSISQQITVAWRALSAIDDPEGWVSIDLYKYNNWSILVSYNSLNREQAIIFKIKNDNANSSLPMAQGFKVLPLKGELGPGFVVVRQNEGDIELFTKMVTDICHTVIQHQTLCESKLASVFINRINAWLSFMDGDRRPLSPEAELGLVGELEILYRLLSLNIPTPEVIASWKGPLGGIKDFEFRNGAVETKSTISRAGMIVKIGSLEQLDISKVSPLFLNGNMFSISPEGQTLVDRVNLVATKLKSYPGELAKFNNLLLRCGYLESDAECYIRKFKVEKSLFWLVDENFPRLVPENIAVYINKAQYEINLTPLMIDSVEMKIVVQRLGMA
ncbi:PD-(D/E)XK motif protein [Neisseriaceae bacterium CLB008]